MKAQNIKISRNNEISIKQSLQLNHKKNIFSGNSQSRDSLRTSHVDVVDCNEDFLDASCQELEAVPHCASKKTDSHTHVSPLTSLDRGNNALTDHNFRKAPNTEPNLIFYKNQNQKLKKKKNATTINYFCKNQEKEVSWMKIKHKKESWCRLKNI